MRCPPRRNSSRSMSPSGAIAPSSADTMSNLRDAAVPHGSERFREEYRIVNVNACGVGSCDPSMGAPGRGRGYGQMRRATSFLLGVALIPGLILPGKEICVTGLVKLHG